MDWTYASPSLKRTLGRIKAGGESTSTRFTDASGYKDVSANFYAIQDNYLDVVDVKYYIPTEISEDYATTKKAQGEKPVKLANGEIDLIDALYTQYNESNTWNSSDPFDVSSQIDNVNQTFTKINIVIPEGYRNVISMNTEKVARICMSDCKATY